MGIAVAGSAVAAVSVALTLADHQVSEPGGHAALNTLITVTFVFAGLTAWWRRPESRFGPLMVAADSPDPQDARRP